MATCETVFCNNPAEVEKKVDAPFSMSSNATNSSKTLMICIACADQDERMASVSAKATINIR